MMRLIHDPLPLIFSHGDAATQLSCLEFLGLSDSPRSRACQLALVQQQRADGAFPSFLDPSEWGTVSTTRNALLLLSTGLPAQGVNVASAIRFLLQQQNDDGGWCENPAVEIPPERLELNNQRSVTWMTADAVELLRRVGMGHRQECQAGLQWLRGMQNRHGGWYTYSGAIGEQRDGPGDPDSTAQISFLLGEVLGEGDPAYLRGRASFERSLDECVQDVDRGYRFRFSDGASEPLDAYGLTFLLLSSLVDSPRRIQAGYNVHEPRVKRIVQALLDIQGEDGGWRPYWMEESSPVYTALALKVLILSEAVARDELQGWAQAYAAAGGPKGAAT